MNVLNLSVADKVCQLIIDDPKIYKRFQSEYKFIADKSVIADLLIFIKNTVRDHPVIQTNIKNYSYTLKFPLRKLSLTDLQYSTETAIGQLLVTKNILLFHASALKFHNKGFVFCGPGGVGKSTIIKLSSKTTPLSDDTTIIKKIGKKYYIYASPFDKIKCPDIKTKKIQLKKIFILKKSNKTQIILISHVEAVKRVIRNSLLRYFGTYKSRKVLYKFCLNLVTIVPVEKLYFTKDREFLKVI